MKCYYSERTHEMLVKEQEQYDWKLAHEELLEEPQPEEEYWLWMESDDWGFYDDYEWWSSS